MLEKAQAENSGQQPQPIHPLKVEIKVVRELPIQPVREYTKEDGTLVKFITVEEYLTGEANAGTQ